MALLECTTAVWAEYRNGSTTWLPVLAWDDLGSGYVLTATGLIDASRLPGFAQFTTEQVEDRAKQPTPGGPSEPPDNPSDDRRNQ